MKLELLYLLGMITQVASLTPMRNLAGITDLTTSFIWFWKGYGDDTVYAALNDAFSAGQGK